MLKSIYNTITLNIEPGSPEFNSSILSLFDTLKEHRVTFFTGAGVSKPSGLPLAKVLCENLLNAMEKSLEIINIGSKNERHLIKEILKGYRLERLLDSLVDSHNDQVVVEYLNHVMQNANENYNHKAIARLAKAGYINHLITLNFDTLFEQALSNQFITYSWYLPLASPILIPNSENQFIIVKPHGTLPLNGLSFAPHYLSATLQYAGDRPQLENLTAIKSVLSKDPVLFVAGYSDYDWDISPIMTRIPWSHVYWCQFDANEKFNNSIIKWFNSRSFKSTTIYIGDVRKIFTILLKEVSTEYNNQENIPRIPDSSIFLHKPEATALAAIKLLDGTSNELYCKLLPQFGEYINQNNNPQIYRKWEKAMAWYHHAHKRNIRKAIDINLRLFRTTQTIANENNLIKIKDIRSIYYEFISAAKRPHSNFRWPIDLIIAYRYRKSLKHQAIKIIKSDTVNPWIIKETERQIAFTDFYVIDLFHNWGYYLLPFKNSLARFITRKAFQFIFSHYQKLADLYPILNWEYHYVRSIEAALIAHKKLQVEIIKEKLSEILEMFIETDQHGHADYVKSINAIIDNSESDFSKVEKSFFNNNTGTSPTGKLRMILFRRYFWPNTMNTSIFSLFKYLSKYTSI